MNFITWMFLGFVSGWIASIISKNTQSIFTNISLGIIGALVGGILMNMIGQHSLSGFNFYTIVVSILGAVVLIWFGRITNNINR